MFIENETKEIRFKIVLVSDSFILQQQSVSRKKFHLKKM